MKKLGMAILAATLMIAQAAVAQEIRIGVRASPAMDPHYLWLSTNTQFSSHIFDSLTDKAADDNKLIPRLASEWTAVDDSTWEFKLRQGVTWHDGTPLTADDVAASIARVPALPNNPNPYTYTIQSIKEVVVVDPVTIRFKTDGPKPYLPGEISHLYIVPKKIAETATTADFRSGKAAIGTGPYKFQEFVPDSHLVLVRNESWWGGKPTWAKITFRFIGNDAARMAALLSGDVDVVDYVPPSDVTRLKSDSRITVASKRTSRFLYLKMEVTPGPRDDITAKSGGPLDRNPLSDVRVRHALSMAIDRSALSERTMEGMSVPATQLVPPGFNGYNDAIQPVRYDIAGAKALLAEAGYPDGFGIAIGCSNDRYVNDGQLCQAIGQMLSRTGLQMKVEALPATVFFSKVRAPKPEFSLFMSGWGSAMTGEADALWAMARTYDPGNKVGQMNAGGYSNAEADRLIDEARGTLDKEKRGRLLQQVMKIVIDDYAMIPIHFQSVALAARTGFEVEARMDEETRATNMRATK